MDLLQEEVIACGFLTFTRDTEDRFGVRRSFARSVY
jgi:hypothetical protein